MSALKSLRIAAGFTTQMRAAVAARVREAYMSAWECGVRGINVENARKLADAYGVSMEVICDASAQDVAAFEQERADD